MPECNIPSVNARNLLQAVLPEDAWATFERKRVIVVNGKRNIYVLSPVNQTQVRDKNSGKVVARACLQLSVHAPCFDRLVAEYLILLNNEEFYWSTANIFPQDAWDMALPMVMIGDIVLFLNLLLELLVSK